MRLNAALASAIFSSATLLGYVHADESEAAPDATSTGIARPTFTVCRGALLLSLSVLRRLEITR